MIKRVLYGIGLLVLISVLAAVGAIVWAQSSTMPSDTYATLTTYDAPGAAPRDTLSVMAYNIGYLSGMTNNQPVERDSSLFTKNMSAVVDMLRASSPDIIGFQEIDFGAARSLKVHQLDTLGVRAGYSFGAQAVNWDVRYLPFPSDDPAFHFGMVQSGQAVLSRYPVVSHERVALQRTSRPFWNDAFYLDRLAQITEVAVGADTLTIINVHLEAFEEETREAQAEEVRRLVQDRLNTGDTENTGRAARPVLLMGDFNSVPPAAREVLPEEERTAFATDETIARLLDGLSLQSAFPDSMYTGAPEAVATYPADVPTRPIDHIYYTPEHIEALDATVLNPPGPPSDHRPVQLRFVLK